MVSGLWSAVFARTNVLSDERSSKDAMLLRGRVGMRVILEGDERCLLIKIPSDTGREENEIQELHSFQLMNRNFSCGA